MPHATVNPTVKLMDDVIEIFADPDSYFPPDIEMHYTGPNADNRFTVQKSYERKVIGLGSSRVRTVLMYADNENVQAFGIGTGIKTGDMWKQYLHTVAATLDVQSNISEADHYELVSDITEVLKYNKIYGDWISIEVLGSKNLSGEMRNRWRTVIDIRGKIYAPNA